MNVQNLREKFNQPGNGSVSSPGTSFGVTLKSTAKTPSTATNKTTAVFTSAARAVDQPSQFHSVKLRSSKSPSPERFAVTSTLSRSGAHLRSSKSPSPDPPPHINGVIGAKAVITNGDFDCRARTHLKSPEQAQKEVILRKWNRNSSNNDEALAAPTTVDSPAPAKAKKCVSKFIAHLSSTENDATSGRDNDAILVTDNGLSADSRNDRYNSTNESSTSMSHSQAYGERQNSAPVNATSTTSAMAARPANSSFLHNDVRPKASTSTDFSVTNSQLKANVNSVPAPFVSQNSSSKLSPAADRWKATANAEPEFATPKLNSAADRWKPTPAPAAINSEPEFRRVTLTKGEFFYQYI